MTRVHTFRPNLDGDRALERVQVYNVSQGEMSSPTTYFRVADLRNNKFVNVQLVRVFQSPGSSESGLKQAWVRDLNLDGRVEIAVRDFATPSVGETLSIYRQWTSHALRFSRLQTIVGDQVTKTSASSPVGWSVLIKANHSPDGRVHHESWSWSPVKKKWLCTTDCVPR
jgi:hypothetical protein